MTARRSSGVVAVLLAVAVAAGLTVSPALAQNGDTDVSVTIPPAPTSSPTTPPLPAAPVVPTPPGGSDTGGGFSGGSGSGSGSAAVPDAPVAPEPASGEPAIGSKPGRGDTLVLDRDFVMPGETVVARATGLTAGEMAQMVLFSDPVLLSNEAVDAEGSYRAEIVIPEDTEPGRHTLQLTGWSSSKIFVGVLVVGDPASDEDEAGGGFPLWIWWIVAALLILGLAGIGIRAAISVRRNALPTGAHP
ncbi:hypothetical protein [Aeromicrobium sp. Leaf350]|uniref:hypothetical protein n=1 Tax=Aeromicrobium sp. Leaf350 TaxID=2876565 RepID=UPI001E31B246|nr:hypothetical protein [Aeromicrobium sp. Leaf350]